MFVYLRKNVMLSVLAKHLDVVAEARPFASTLRVTVFLNTFMATGRLYVQVTIRLNTPE